MTPKQYHTEAMSLYFEAQRNRAYGDLEVYTKLLQDAYEKELQAVEILRTLTSNAEPTLSLLIRSAASFSLELGLYEAAERLIVDGLYRNMNSPLKEDFHALLEQARFGTHLDVNGVSLDPTEIQLSFGTGTDVGYGYVRTDEFVQRIDALNQMVLRTVERKQNRPYRAAGMISREISTSYGLYLHTLARAGSFAITLKMGKPKDLRLDLQDPLIVEVLDLIELVHSNQEEALREAIPNRDYYSNFISQAKLVAPDGEKIKQVGLTYQGGGTEKRISFTRPSRDIVLAPQEALPTMLPSQNTLVISPTYTAVGTLSIGDGDHLTIKLSDLQDYTGPGSRRTIQAAVPSGLQSYVKEFFLETVQATFQDVNGKTNLVDMNRHSV